MTCLNNIFYPYIREHYLSKVDRGLRGHHQELLQSATLILKFKLNELMYQAIKENGFKELAGNSGALSTYCSKKVTPIIEVAEDIMTRYVNAEKFYELGVFEYEQEYCKKLIKSLYDALSTPYDESKPSATGFITQILQHDASTKKKIAELESDPFDAYNMNSEAVS